MRNPRRTLTILYTSPQGKEMDLPSIGWLTLEDGASYKHIAMGKPEVLACYQSGLVQKIVRKSAPPEDHEWSQSLEFELTEAAFNRCEKLLNNMGAAKWEVHNDESDRG
jgi:hypothetical protein